MPPAVALLFPGQGSQAVGMGLDLAERFAAVARWFDEAEAACGLPLKRLCREAPEDELRLTENLQPTLLTVEIGYLLAWRELTEAPVVAALGHSLGEYAALVAAGALDAATAVALVRKRGRYMQEAAPVGLGGMSAVIGLDADRVTQLCHEASTAESGVWLSNDNCPGQVVISGHLAAIERVTPQLEAAGAKRVMPLRVSAPFHCPLMAPVAERMTGDLARTRFTAPGFPVIANCCAQPYADAPSVPAGLAKQIVAPVQFRASLAQLPERGVTHLIELGPGNVLTGLARRTLPGVPVYQTGSAEKLAAVRDALTGGA